MGGIHSVSFGQGVYFIRFEIGLTDILQVCSGSSGSAGLVLFLRSGGGRSTATVCVAALFGFVWTRSYFR